MLNKRGLSTVVTTLIIILLVLVSIGIVWAVISNILQRGTETTDNSFRCLNIDIRATSISGCFNVGSQYTCTVNFVRKSGGGEIAGLNVRFYDEIGEESLSIIDIPGNIEPLLTISKIVSGIDSEALPSSVNVTIYLNDSNGEKYFCPQITSYHG